MIAGHLTRARAASMLAVQRGTVVALALAGDPLARILRGTPNTDVYAAYERLRRRGEVSRSRLGPVVVTSHRLCDQVLRDPRFGVQPPEGTPPTLVDVVGAGPLGGSFLELDPPDHTRLRRIVAPAFRPRLVRDLAPMIEKVLRETAST